MILRLDTMKTASSPLRLSGLVLVFTASAFGIVACSAATKTVVAPPLDNTYEIDFLAVRTAVSVERIQVWLFPGGADNVCSDLTARLRSGQALPDPIQTTDEVGLCDVYNGKAAKFTQSFGDYTVMVLAKRSGKPWLVGCAQGTVTKDSGPLVVSVTPFDATVAIPPTSCTTVRDRCSGACS